MVANATVLPRGSPPVHAFGRGVRLGGKKAADVLVSKMKPRKKYRPRMVRIPMGKNLHDAFGMQMHASLATMRVQPCLEAWDALGWIFNVVCVTIKDDARFTSEMTQIQQGVEAMNECLPCAESNTMMPYSVTAQLTAAVSVIDDILPRLDVTKLHLANLSLKAAI